MSTKEADTECSKKDIMSKQQQTAKRSGSSRLKNEHVLLTMNFLYSAAHLVPSATLSVNMTRSAVTLKEKHTGRFTPSLKRSMCGKCKVLLVPGNTAKVRIRTNEGGQFRVVTCVMCGWYRRFLVGNEELKIEKCPVFDNT